MNNSKKIYVHGPLHQVKVAMRQIELSETKLHNGGIEVNAPVTVYDTSGAFTDENLTVDIKKGLPRLREEWILNRNDVEELDQVSSVFGQQRLDNPTLDHLRFEHLKKPLIKTQTKTHG